MSEPVEETTWGQELAAAGEAIDAEFAEMRALLATALSDDVLDDAAIADLQQQVAAVSATRDAALAEVARLKALYEPEPPPPPVESKMKVGSSLWREFGETSQDAFDRRTNDWGIEPEIVRYFFTGLPVGPWPQFGQAQTVVSFKPAGNDVAGLAAGKFDAQISSFLDTCAKDGKPKRLAVYHEREDNIEDGEFTKPQAKAMDAKVRELIDAANARNPEANIRFGLVLMGWTVDARSGRNIDDYLPIGWKYDWLGWDAYPGDNPSLDLPNLTYTTALYQRCKEATAAHNPKAGWLICETGTRNHNSDDAETYDSKQAAWITGAASAARDLGAKGWIYFDSTVGGDFRIQGSAGFAAMGAEIGK